MVHPGAWDFERAGPGKSAPTAGNGRREHSRERLHAIDDLPVGIASPGRRAAVIGRKVQVRDEQIPRIEPEVDRGEPDERSDQQPGAEKEYDGQSDLRDDEAVAHPRAAATRGATPPRVPGTRHDVGSGVLQKGGQQPDTQRRQRRDYDRKPQDGPVDSQLCLRWYAQRWHEHRQRPDAGIREPGTEKQPAECEQPGLNEHLANDVAAARTHGETSRDLLVSRRRAGQQHVRNVTAGNDEEQAHSTEQRVHDRTKIADDKVDPFLHHDSCARRIRVRIFSGATRRNNRELRLGLTERHTWTQTGHERPRRCIRPRIVAPRENRRKPDIGRIPPESGRHHSDDGPRLAIEHEGPADDRRVRPELSNPGPVRYHRHRRRARHRVAGSEGASEQCGNTEEGETVRGHPRNVQPRRPHVAGRVHTRLEPCADDILEHAGLFLVIQELLRREQTAQGPAGRVSEAHVDQAFRVGVRKGIQNDIPDDAVDDGDGTNPERQGQDRDAGESRGSAECPGTVEDVSPKVFEPHGRQGLLA